MRPNMAHHATCIGYVDPKLNMFDAPLYACKQHATDVFSIQELQHNKNAVFINLHHEIVRSLLHFCASTP